ncbi:MAG: hypothetical protein EKK48_15115, partial [Candidatus Melainabacteria bacterium]
MVETPPPTDDSKKPPKATDKTTVGEKKPAETTLNLTNIVGDGDRRTTLTAVRPAGKSIDDGFGIDDYTNITAKVNTAGLVSAPGGEFAPKQPPEVKQQSGPFVVSQVSDGKVVQANPEAQALAGPQQTTLKPGDANFIPAGWIQYPTGPAPEVANAPATDTAIISGPPRQIDQGVDATGQHLVQTLNADGSYVTKDTNRQPPRVVAEKDSAGRESKFVYQNGNLVEVDNATGNWKLSADGNTWQNEKGQTFKGSITVNDSTGSFQYQDRSTGISTTWNPDGSHQVQFKDGTKFDGKDFDANGKATIVKDGVSTSYSLDGNKTVTNPDKSTIQSNPDGQVTKITTPDNKTYEFQYDANGRKTGVKNEYGWWHSPDGGNTWVNDTDKTKVKGTFDVTRDGTYTFTSAPKAGDKYPEKETRTADGTVIIQKGDGTSVSTQADGSTVNRDSQGRPTLVTSADGKSKYTFGYDGNTTTFTNSKGDWTSTDGQNWTLKSDATQTYKGTIGVDEKGNIVQTDAGTGIKHLTQTDGSTLEVRPDGSSLQRDKENRIIKESDAGGHVSEFTYNADGTIKSTKNESGTWTSADGKNWTNGTDTWTGSMAIDQLTGTTVYQDGKGVKQIANLDGTKVAENPDGSQLQYDKAGRLSTVVDARGQSSTYTYNGDKLSDIKTPTGTYHSVDGGNSFVSTDGSGKVISGVQLDASGQLKYKDSASNSTVQNLDGSVITTNRAGSVTNVIDGNGKTYSYNYDANNKLVSFTSPAGSFSSTDGGKTFSNGTTTLNEVAVDKNGTLNYHDSTGASTRLYADGSSYVFKKDTSSIETNKFGQVTEIFDAKGNRYSFGYDAKGNLTDVQNADGHWKATDSTGKNWVNDNGDKWSGSITVKTDGTYSFTNNFGEKSTVDIKTGDITTRMPDGSSRVQGVNPDTGDKYLKSATDAAGHTVKYDYDPATGKLKSITDGTNVLTSTDGVNFQGKDGTTYTNLKISDNGLPSLTDAAGMVHSHQADGSVITTTKDGHVKQVIDSVGKVNNFDYDAQGLKTINSGGTIFERNADGTFTDKSTPPKTFNVTVGADGSQQWVSTDGNTQLTIRANGSQLEVNSFYGLPSSTVERDATGKVLGIEDAQERYTTVKYTNGQPSQISDGTRTWTLSADGKTWTSDLRGDAPFKGTVTIDSHGNQVWTDANSKVVTTINSDGSTIKANPNGSRVETNAYGDSTTYVHAPVNGKQTEVTVDANGNIRVKNGADGSVLTQENGSGKFTLTDAQGNVLQTGNGRITVDSKTGNTTITNSDTGSVQVLRADGVGQVANKAADGTYTDGSGKPVVVTPPAPIPPVVPPTPTAPVFGPKPNVPEVPSSPLGKIAESAPVVKAPEVVPVVQAPAGQPVVTAPVKADVPQPVVNNGPPVYQAPPPQSTFTPPATKIADSNTVGLVATTMRVDPPAPRVEPSNISYGGGGPGAPPVVERISSSSNAPELFKQVASTDNNTGSRYTPIDNPVIRSENFNSSNNSNSIYNANRDTSSVRLDVPPVRQEQQPVNQPVSTPERVQATPEPPKPVEVVKAPEVVKTAEPVKAPDVVKAPEVPKAPDAVVSQTKPDVITQPTQQRDVTPPPTVTPTVEKDSYGRVTSITDSVGNKTLIEYAPGPNGQPVRVSDASGNTVYTLKDGVWTSPGAPAFKGTLTVDASGKQTWTDSATQAFKTISPDGSQMIVKADGSRVAISPDHQTTTYYLAPVNGKVTEVTVGPNGTEIKNSEGYLLRQANGNVLTVFDPKGNVIKETTGTVTIDSKTGMVTITPMERTTTQPPVGTPVVLPGPILGYPGTTKDNGTNFYGQPVEVKAPSVPVTVTNGSGNSTGSSVAVGPVQATPGPVNLGSGGTLNLSTNTGVAIGSANGSVVVNATNNGHGNTGSSTAVPITNTNGTVTGTGTNVATNTGTVVAGTTAAANTGTGTVVTGANTANTGANTANTSANTAGNVSTANVNTGIVNTGNSTTVTTNAGTNLASNSTSVNTSGQTLNSTATTGTVSSLPSASATTGSANNATTNTGTLGNSAGTNIGANANSATTNAGTTNVGSTANAGTVNTGSNVGTGGTLNTASGNATGTGGTNTSNAGTATGATNVAGNSTANNAATTAASVINSNSGNSANSSLSLSTASGNVNALPAVNITGKDPGTGGTTGNVSGSVGGNQTTAGNVSSQNSGNSTGTLGTAAGSNLAGTANSGVTTGANASSNQSAAVGTGTANSTGNVANSGGTLSSQASGTASNVLGGNSAANVSSNISGTGTSAVNTTGTNAGTNAASGGNTANAGNTASAGNTANAGNTASAGSTANAGNTSAAGSTANAGNTTTGGNLAGNSAGNNVVVSGGAMGNATASQTGATGANAGTSATGSGANAGSNVGANSGLTAGANQGTQGAVQGGANQGSAGTMQSSANQGSAGTLQSGANQGSAATLQSGANQGNAGTLQSGANQGTNQGNAGTVQGGANQGNAGTV